MAHILHIDSSPRGDRSISRQLTKEFITAWKATFPNDSVAYRDLGHYPVPFIDEAWIAASFTSPEQITPNLESTLVETSDTLIDELLAADVWLFGIPMYNYSVPANCKAYIDQIVRVRRTFIVHDQGEYQGLVDNKKVFVITARGGTFSPSTPNARFDFQEPFLQTVFNLIGVNDITFIHTENLAGGIEARQQSLENARAEIQHLIAACGGLKP
ncbi:FMN-dependent NADH-azoreductase [Gloeocapsopsis dulcis]|uniref:FMN dependent NADH:quinone oxidoreductase n=1 Tax=Gloeocapsopsis dulcis AAB1 = 1H9 TaxID=1433147 RepID=A0A6N8G1R4_9CHRO|nr:NAD(P)H-dependent oxidoreductase [Gloeocapsopsis dulcis]MUL38535.1 FMN-dependent NADH-azoreductase [Gloeocapsopsis dulcis AAB1 = 1H9]WNN90665.1 NAD(P)H-dependent oxidoreductase [Gloeocapsopsis dulcis]